MPIKHCVAYLYPFPPFINVQKTSEEAASTERFSREDKLDFGTQQVRLPPSYNKSNNNFRCYRITQLKITVLQCRNHTAQRSSLWSWLLILVFKNFTVDTTHRLCFYTVKTSKPSFDELINLGPVPDRPISANPGLIFFTLFVFTSLCIAQSNNVCYHYCISHRCTGNFLPRRAVNHLPKKFSQVAQIFPKNSKRNEVHTMQQPRSYWHMSLTRYSFSGSIAP